MAAMTLAQLQWRTRRLAGLDATDSRLDPLDVSDAINDALDELLGMRDWEFLYDTADVAVSADQDTYTLPVALRTVGQVTLDGVRALPRAVHAEREVWNRDVEYELVGTDTIRLRPTPTVDGTLTVAGWRQWAALSAPDDTPDMPSGNHRTIAYLAALGLLAEDPEVADDDKRLQLYTGIITGDLDRMAGFAQRHHERGTFVMGGRSRRRNRPGGLF